MSKILGVMPFKALIKPAMKLQTTKSGMKNRLEHLPFTQ